jgi:hypothetical protein
MSAAKKDIYIEQGASFSYKLTVSSSSVPVDVTSWTFSGQVRRTYDASAILASFTFTILDQVTNTGEVLVELTDTVTSGIPAEKDITNYVYDIEAAVSGKKYRLYQGKAVLSAEVTR